MGQVFTFTHGGLVECCASQNATLCNDSKKQFPIKFNLTLYVSLKEALKYMQSSIGN